MSTTNNETTKTTSKHGRNKSIPIDLISPIVTRKKPTHKKPTTKPKMHKKPKFAGKLAFWVSTWTVPHFSYTLPSIFFTLLEPVYCHSCGVAPCFAIGWERIFPSSYNKAKTELKTSDLSEIRQYMLETIDESYHLMTMFPEPQVQRPPACFVQLIDSICQSSEFHSA